MLTLCTDFDPEDDPDEFSDDDASNASDDHVDVNAGRSHYAAVDKSKLRERDVVPLGPQYTGSRVSRKVIDEEEEEHDPFEAHGSDEGSGDLDLDVDGIDENDGEEEGSGSDDIEEDDFSGGETENTSISEDGDKVSEDEDEDMEDDADEQQDNQVDREQLKKMMKEERGNVAATIAQANKADADKGRAVKSQRQTFDALLNSRIRLQQGLVAMNSMVSDSPSNTAASAGADAIIAAEQAALNLWNTLESLRESLSSARTGTKRKRVETTPDDPTSAIWQRMQAAEAATQPHRRSILHKWSSKTQSASAQPTRGKLAATPARGPTTIVDVLDEQLSNPARLVARTRTPRSCAPLQAAAGIAASAAIYDDADFYGLLLKELLEQRSIDAAANVSVNAEAMARQHWQAAREAKTKKNVDTKASKGRKLRYTVHERLQNYMAPEDRAAWTERQIDELFGSLLGRRMVLGEGDGEMEGDAKGVVDEEEALMLFRS